MGNWRRDDIERFSSHFCTCRFQALNLFTVMNACLYLMPGKKSINRQTDKPTSSFYFISCLIVKMAIKNEQCAKWCIECTWFGQKERERELSKTNMDAYRREGGGNIVLRSRTDRSCCHRTSGSEFHPIWIDTVGIQKRGGRGTDRNTIEQTGRQNLPVQ